MILIYFLDLKLAAISSTQENSLIITSRPNPAPLLSLSQKRTYVTLSHGTLSLATTKLPYRSALSNLALHDESKVSPLPWLAFNLQSAPARPDGFPNLVGTNPHALSALRAIEWPKQPITNKRRIHTLTGIPNMYPALVAA